MIERYHRVYCYLGEREATVGIEQRDGDDLLKLGGLIKCDAQLVLHRLPLLIGSRRRKA